MNARFAMVVALLPLTLGCASLGDEPPADVAGETSLDAVEGTDAAPGDSTDATEGTDPAPTEGTDPGPDAVAQARPLIDAGIKALGAYCPDLARDDFQQALDVDPGNREALYGMVLTDFQKAWQLIDMLVAELKPPASITQENPPPAPPPPLADPVKPTEMLSDFLEKAIDGLTAIGNLQLSHIDQILADPSDVSITVPAMPLHFGTLDFLTFHGRWTRADLLYISAGQKMITGIFTYLHGLSFQGNLLDKISLNSSIGASLGGDLFGAIPEVMGRSADFLTFAAGGADDFAHAIQLLSEAGKDGLKARQLLEAETGDLSDRVFQVGPVHVNAGIKMTSTRVAVKGAKGDGAVVLWQGKTLSVAAFFDVLGRNAGGDPSVRLSLSGHLVPLLAVLLDVVRQSAGLMNVVGMLGLGSVGDVVGAIDDQVPDTPEDVPALLASVVGSLLLPDGLLELDLATDGLRPLPLRSVLPMVTDTDPYKFVQRFDCPILGAAATTADATYQVVLLDPDGEVDKTPGPGNDSTAVCFRTKDAAGTLLDLECTTMAEDAAVEGRFVGAIQAVTVADAAAIVHHNGTLDLPGGAADSVEAVYLDGACSPANEVVVTWKGGKTDRTLDAFASCWDGLACDRPHRFPGALVIDDPPAAATSTKPMTTLPADGWASVDPYRAWPSPSFNGLLWVDVSKLSKADPKLDASKTPVGAGMKKLDPVSANMFFSLLPKMFKL